MLEQTAVPQTLSLRESRVWPRETTLFALPLDTALCNPLVMALSPHMMPSGNSETETRCMIDSTFFLKRCLVQPPRACSTLTHDT